MNIVLIGCSKGHAVRRLGEEAQKKGVEFSVVPVRSVVFRVQDNMFSLSDEEGGSLMGADCYLFRGIGEADQEVMVMAKYLLRHGKVVIEETAAYGALMMDKLFLHATEHDIPTLDYVMVQGRGVVEKLAPNLTYPLVVKSTIGSMGKFVALVKDQEELLQTYQDLGPRVILQKYAPVSCDYRAIVIGGRYLGAYSRERADGEFRMNKPGNHKTAVELPQEAVDLCERAAQYQGIEVAGIDLIHHEEKWYVLEINTSPQFKQFEKETGTNVAERIIEYAMEKVAQPQTHATT